MGRTFGAKDTVKIHRRTRAELEGIKNLHEQEVKEAIRNEQMKELKEKNILVSRELVTLAGLTEEELLTSLKQKALDRLERAINE